MTKAVKIFFDTEFTGLHQDTTLISIGLVSDCGRSFYAEFNDYDESQVTPWIKENVISYLIFNNQTEVYPRTMIAMAQRYSMKSNSSTIAQSIKVWLSQFHQVEMWSDCLAYDWVLFNNLYGSAFDIPKNIYYIPFDLCTLFKLKGVDPDISREEFSEYVSPTNKHNALHDAKVIKTCFNKLMAVEPVASI